MGSLTKIGSEFQELRYSIMTDRLDSWKDNYWSQDNTPWHIQAPNSSLVKHWETVRDGRQGLRVLFPLCGASVDLAWLHSQGHSVVGVEGVRKAADKLFTEADLDYTVDKMEDGQVWKYSSRGALEAIELEDREKYVSTIHGCLRKKFDYILSGYDYDKSLKTGPPRPLPSHDVQQLFENKGNVEIINEEEDDGTRQRFGLPWLKKFTYLISGSS